jgi:hypothetical protein
MAVLPELAEPTVQSETSADTVEQRAQLAGSIVERVKSNLSSAIFTRAMLVRINDDEGMRTLFDKSMEANGLNSVYRVLLHDLILTLNRLYDTIDAERRVHLNRESLPHLMHLLEDEALRNHFIADARTWPGWDKERNAKLASDRIERARTAYHDLRNGELAPAFTGLKWFRDANLAHSLRGVKSKTLLYGHIGDLLERTSPIVKDLALGVLGQDLRGDGSGEAKRVADAFWDMAALGMKAVKRKEERRLRRLKREWARGR